MEKIYEGREQFTRYLVNTRPKTMLYKTVSHKRAFSSEYELKVPNDFNNRSFASVAGTAFDYLARFLVARKSKFYKMEVLSNLKAYDGIRFFKKEKQDYYVKKLEDCHDKIKAYVMKAEGVEITDIILASCYYARLEHNARTNWIPNEETEKFLEHEDESIVNNLLYMAIVFDKEFIQRIVKEDSDIVYNPTFGECSEKLGGADSDIFIDGVLYDFKTTKHFEAKTVDETQLWQYFIYHCVAKRNNDRKSTLFDKEIKALALYKARFGEIEYVKISDIKEELIYMVGANVLGTLSYLKYYNTIDGAFMAYKNKVIFDRFRHKM